MRSFAVAAGFGLASVLSVIVLGDESGYTTGEVQKVKLAAIEAEWETVKQEHTQNEEPRELSRQILDLAKATRP